MRIMVFGAGVLGSLLAHELTQTGHEVTVLARGRRFDELQAQGLVIQHVRQKTRTVDKVWVTNHLDAGDDYDIIFAVLQKSQLAAALPQLVQNGTAKRLVLIGNNCEAEKTAAAFHQVVPDGPRLLFGFMSCAGHREDGVVYNWHTDKCRLTIGALDGAPAMDELITETVKDAALEPVPKQDVNAWLKHHAALIVPLALAIQAEGGAGKHLRKSQPLLIAVDAVKECINMFEAQGIHNEPPHKDSLMRWSAKRWRWWLARLLSTKTGQLMAVDHSLAAMEEISLLAQELFRYSQEYGYPLPALEKLYGFIHS